LDTAAPNGLAGFGDVEEPDVAEVVRYVDPDATGSGDGTSWTDAYTSLSAWEAAEQTDLVADGDWHHVYCRSSGGTADSTAVVIDGWTTGPSNYILIEAASGDEAVKTGIDTSRYRLTAASGNAIENRIDDLTIRGIQFDCAALGIYASKWQNTSADVTIDQCYLKTGSAGITGYGSSVTINVESSIIVGDAAPNYGIHAQDGTWNIYNCVVYGYDHGLYEGASGPTITIENCALFSNNDDIESANASVDYCASDDGDGTNSVSPSGSSWANEFEDAANGDFTLLTGGNLENGGTTITGGPSTDIDGDSWDATPSIGADEYVASGGGTTVSADLLSASGELLAPTVTGAAAVSADLLTGSAELLAPTVAAAALVPADLLSATAELPAPTVAGAAVVRADLLSATAELPAPTVTGAATVSANLLTAEGALLAPTVQTSAGVTTDLLTATADLLEPTVSGGAIVSADLLSATGELLAPTVSAFSGTVVVADLLEATASLFDPTVSGAATVSADLLTAEATLLAPSTAAGLTVAADLLTAGATLLAPSVALTATFATDLLQADAELLAPSLVYQGGVSADLLTATATLLAPTLIMGDVYTEQITGTSSIQTAITGTSSIQTAITGESSL
jgi:hypothetical protein